MTSKKSWTNAWRVLALSSFFCMFSMGYTVAQVNPLAQGNFRQDQYGINWRSLESSFFKVIFPKHLEKTAQETTSLLEQLRPQVNESLKIVTKKIPLVLHPDVKTPNGFVTIAPFRTEWYTTPLTSPDLGSTEWLTTLAVHEYRHVAQFEKADQSFNKVWKFLFGDVGRGLGFVISMPPWAAEGDATGEETFLTNGGRGRTQRFLMPFKASIMENSEQDLETYINGSFNFRVPNAYLFGYYFTSYLKQRFGRDVMGRIVDDSSSGSYWPFAFYSSIEDITGLEFDVIYNDFIIAMKKRFSKEHKKIENDKPQFFTRSQSAFDFYAWPYVINKTMAYAVSGGFEKRTAIVQINLDTGRQEKVFHPNLSKFDRVCYANDSAVFREIIPHPRWGNKEYSRITIANLRTGKSRFINKSKNYLSPCFESNGKYIVAVEMVGSRYHLVTLNKIGRELKRKKFDKGLHPMDPIAWKDDVFFVLQQRPGLYLLMKWNVRSNKVRKILDTNNRFIFGLTTNGSELCFEDDPKGSLNIYCLNLKSKKLVAKTQSKYAATNPFIFDNWLYQVRYGFRGFNIARTPLSANVKPASHNRYFVDAVKEKKSTINKKSYAKRFKSQSYSGMSDLINFHSWFYYVAPFTPSAGIQLQSNNLLNTFSLNVGMDFNFNEETKGFFIKSSIMKLYPIIDFELDKQERTSSSSSGVLIDRWDETIGSGAISILSKKQWNQVKSEFKYGVASSIRDISSKQSALFYELDNTLYYDYGGDLSWEIALPRLVPAVYPIFQNQFYLRYRVGENLERNSAEGELLSIKNILTLPSISTHNLVFESSFEKQSDNRFAYRYESAVEFTRGYQYVYFPTTTKLSANYVFPLFFPDFSLGKWAYNKRIYANLFYDYLLGDFYGSEYEYSSIGAELVFDLTLFRLLPISLGVRFANRVEDGANVWSIFLAETIFDF